MKVPRRNALKSMKMVVRHRAEPRDITRPSMSTDGRFNETTETTETVMDVKMWLFSPSETSIDTDYGDRLSGDLQGLAKPREDIQKHDRVQHGVATYEVTDIIHLPDDTDRQLKLFSLERVTNDGD